MYKSGVTVSALLEQINNEVDIAFDIDVDVMLQSYNGLIIGLYRDIIKNEVVSKVSTALTKGDGELAFQEEAFKSEQIYRVYTDKLFEAEKVNPTYALITDRTCWYPLGDKAIYLRNFDSEFAYIVYYESPEVVSYNKETGAFINDDAIAGIPLPIDFLDMIKAKIRGDMYAIANDDDLASKWYGIYNSRIEDFKMWVANTKEEVRG